MSRAGAGPVAANPGRVIRLAALALLALAAPLTAGAAPAFRSSVAAIPASMRAQMTGSSWRPGCPVTLDDLRVVRVSYRGFDGASHTGVLIVNRSVTGAVVAAMGTLYRAGFPIRRMQPIDAYGGSDFDSIEADNTSAFNCRPATGSSRWSEHAYGRAIDLDPLENPYVSGGRTSHPASVPYLDRSVRRPGVVHDGDVVVRAFAAVGMGVGRELDRLRPRLPALLGLGPVAGPGGPATAAPLSPRRPPRPGSSPRCRRARSSRSGSWPGTAGGSPRRSRTPARRRSRS